MLGPPPTYLTPTAPASPVPCQAWALADMLAAGQSELEAFLTQIYRAIASAAPLKDKVQPPGGGGLL